MKAIRLLVSLGLAALVAGCGVADVAGWNMRYDNPAIDTAAPRKNLLERSAPETSRIKTVGSFDVRQVNVHVPSSLKVSEANSFYPSGDIVWRGDARGNRYEQIKAIFEAAITRGTAGLNTGTPVEVDIEIRRFHALTQKTRRTFGGVHSIKFQLSIRDVTSGKIIDGPRIVDADLKAFGGRRAIEADRQGQTQKVRITAHLAAVIQTELGAF